LVTTVLVVNVYPVAKKNAIAIQAKKHEGGPGGEKPAVSCPTVFLFPPELRVKEEQGGVGKKRTGLNQVE
jgi:hypothetical protein